MTFHFTEHLCWAPAQRLRPVGKGWPPSSSSRVLPGLGVSLYPPWHHHLYEVLISRIPGSQSPWEASPTDLESPEGRARVFLCESPHGCPRACLVDEMREITMVTVPGPEQH